MIYKRIMILLEINKIILSLLYEVSHIWNYFFELKSKLSEQRKCDMKESMHIKCLVLSVKWLTVVGYQHKQQVDKYSLLCQCGVFFYQPASNVYKYIFSAKRILAIHCQKEHTIINMHTNDQSFQLCFSFPT